MNRITSNDTKYSLEDLPRGKLRERTIGQIFSILKEWRNLRDQKKINLDDAAKLINVPRKSLDEYYKDFKMGRLYGFDFNGNMKEKVSVLRLYYRK